MLINMSDKTHTFLILTARPGINMGLPDFFHVGGEIHKLIANPPSLRRSGWNLRTLDTPRLISGDHWEVKNGDRKRIQLYSDGNLMVRADVGDDFLGWRSETEQPRIHPLAIAEFIYEFVELFRRILIATKVNVDNFNDIEFQIRIIGADQSEIKRKLIPEELQPYGFPIDVYGGKFRLEKDFSEKMVVRFEGEKIYDSRYIALELVRKLYRRFEVTDDIPVAYSSKDGKGKEYIDLDKIQGNQ